MHRQPVRAWTESRRRTHHQLEQSSLPRHGRHPSLAQSDSIAQPQKTSRDMQQCPCSPYSVHFHIGHAMKVTRNCHLVQARARPDAHCLLPHPRRRKMKGSLICILHHGPKLSHCFETTSQPAHDSSWATSRPFDRRFHAPTACESLTVQAAKRSCAARAEQLDRQAPSHQEGRWPGSPGWRTEVSRLWEPAAWTRVLARKHHVQYRYLLLKSTTCMSSSRGLECYAPPLTSQRSPSYALHSKRH